MGVEANTIGNIYAQQADGNYVKIDEFKNIEIITIDRDDGPREHVCSIFEPNKSFGFTVTLDTGKRKRSNNYWQELSKCLFGVTYVEHKFKKKKKRSRKRIRKAFARFTTPIMKER